MAAEPPNKLGADVVFALPNGDAVAPKLFCGGDEAPPKIDGAVLVALPPNIPSGFADDGVPNKLLAPDTGLVAADPPNIFVLCCEELVDTELVPKMLAVVVVVEAALALGRKKSSRIKMNLEDYSHPALNLHSGI